jgi:ribonuclease T1
MDSRCLRRTPRDLARGLVFGCVLVAAAWFAAAPAAVARSTPDGLPTVAVADLPREARHTLALIRAGGPFPYERDGVVFQNRERLLPPERRGHYREYTVRTPGAKNRGARRIVCSGRPTAPAACWYTDDHYASFRRIVE